jgi:PAS domain S-box-containing protein
VDIKNTVFDIVDDLVVEGIAVLDNEGNYVYSNRHHAEIYGYGVEELLQGSWQMFYNEHQIKVIEETVLKPLFEKGKHTAEIIGHRKDGSLITCLVSLQVLPEGMFCIVRDITEEKRLAELEKQNFIQKLFKVIKD